MQGAPTQRPQQPQPQQAPAMPNDPRMGAAMGLVDDSVEKFNLDPQTEALMLKNQALDLLKAADNVGKMNVPQQDTSIQEQTTQGIAGMLQSLAPGMQQRGRQVQQAQARKMIGGGMPARPAPARPPMGGMPTMGAPNMARMADGGIVGYQEGGLLDKIKGIDTKLNAAADARQNERMARGRRMSDYNVLADPYNSAMNIMYDTGIAGALQKLTGYESQLDEPVEEDPTAKQLRNFMAVQDAFKARKAAGAGEEELRRIMEDLNSYTNVVPNIEADAARARGGMARGGIIGYKKGGKPELDAEILAGLPSRVEVSPPSYTSTEDRRAERERGNAVRAANTANRDDEYNLRVQLAARGINRAGQDQYIEAQKAKRQGAVGDFSGLGSLRAPESFRMQGTNNPPEFRMQGTNNPPKPQLDPQGNPQIGSGPFPARIIDDSPIGIATGGMGDDAVGTTETPVAAPQEFTPDALDLLTEEKLKAALNADPDTAATTRGDRLRELTGFDDLMARRIESEKAVRAQKESRLSPEETRKRRIQAGLARLAEQGLGGFGAGRTAEMDKIAAERLGIEETSLADLNSLIAEKRAMGMTQFEAENSARAEIQGSQDNAATAAGRRGDTRRTAEAAAERDRRNIEATATQGGLNRANQLAIAEIQTSGSQFGRSLGIRIKALRDELGFDVSQTEIENQALQSLVDDSLRSDLARLGVQENDQNRKIINDSIEAATKMLTGNIANMTKDPTQLQDEIFTLAEKIRNVVYGSTPSTGGSSTGPAVGTESGGFRFKGGDPADRNNWQEI